MFGFAQLLLVYSLFKGLWRGRKADAQVWEGARGLEWTLSSPPPYHSFTDSPKVDDKLYDYHS